MRILLTRNISRIISGYHILGILVFLVGSGFGFLQPSGPEASSSIPLLLGLVFLAAGLWVHFLLEGQTNARLFSLFCTSSGTAFFAYPLIHIHPLFAYLFTLAFGLALVFLTHLAVHFPRKRQVFDRLPDSALAAAVPVLVLVPLGLPLFYESGSDSFPAGSPAVFWLTGIVILVFVASQAFRSSISSEPLEREQSRLVLVGAVPALLPLFLWLGLRTISTPPLFSLTLLLPAAFFPPVMAYTLLRSSESRPYQRRARGLVYLLLGAATVCGYALFTSGAALITGSLINENHPLLLGLLLFTMAVLFNPIRERIQTLIDERYARRQMRFREYLEAFTKELTQATELGKITDLIRRYTQHGIRPEILHVYLYNHLSGQYEAAPGEDGWPTSDLRFSPDSPVVQTLEKGKNACPVPDPHAPPDSLRLEKTRLALLDARLLIPLPGREGLVGWLGLGARRSGEDFSVEDLNYLETMSDQAALAIERTLVVADLERRMIQMNVLTRVSQGINITLAFDDMLEMLYAQTCQAIPTLDFHITLREPYGNYLYHVFYLENDERLIEKENLPLPTDEGLEEHVIRSGRPLVSDDYERECMSRGSKPSSVGIYAWMSVPLMAGADIIGVISLGNRRPTFTYSSEQLEMLKAIADQASGAIVKARLLQEAERRTRQLTLLNEVARSLTSTLAVGNLLNQILESAVEILNCEAGSLLIPDERTGDMVFKAAYGPVSTFFTGKRLPRGTGLVGKAFDSRQPVVASDVRQTKEWYAQADEQTGFITRELLVVPMLVKDRAIGVIEVINRKDKLPFSPDDIELLSAFASQAAIAMENARLYTLTDQALAARVEELSVMQRIDRELNATLDASRAMQITLSWAMSQSEAEAGLVGMVTESGVRLVTADGYGAELDHYRERLLPDDHPIIQRIQTSGQPWFEKFTGKNGGESLLKQARNQFVIPIRRETEVLGILLLENMQEEELEDEKQAFLARLCDHAAIAIANAQLYTELEAANLAKSDFISFVSHELKTPMTSIRGFTDLLAKGVVGPVNENQANFLGTIRANVDRMATLVSDLADLSRIEAGRLRLDYASVQLGEVVEEVVRSCQAQMDEKQQTIKIQVQAGIPPVWGDRVRLIQILTNLLSNAFKYSPQGSQIAVIACPAQVKKETGSLTSTHLEGQPEMVQVSVQDRGFGIDPEEQKNVFQKFFRSPDQKIRDMPGTGLGLNITKNLVEMQGGKIWFESDLRQGTTFHFTIQASEADNSQKAGSK